MPFRIIQKRLPYRKAFFCYRSLWAWVCTYSITFIDKERLFTALYTTDAATASVSGAPLGQSAASIFFIAFFAHKPLFLVFEQYVKGGK